MPADPWEHHKGERSLLLEAAPTSAQAKTGGVSLLELAEPLIACEGPILVSWSVCPYASKHATECKRRPTYIRLHVQLDFSLSLCLSPSLSLYICTYVFAYVMGYGSLYSTCCMKCCSQYFRLYYLLIIALLYSLLPIADQRS